MNKTGKKILFIVEGENDEPDFFEQARVVFFHNYEINYYTYKTSIHDLIDNIFDGDEIDEDIDIKKMLRANEKDPKMKERLGEKYTDIYMVFDMEPHYHKDNSAIVEKMLCYFNDATQNGKLYINYPMMQSYKHLKSMPDDEFMERKVSKEKVSGYKELVGKVSHYQDVKKLNFDTLLSLCAHHLKKVNYILSSSYILPSISEYMQFDYTALYSKQYDMWKTEEYIYVLNTSIFWLLEYEPMRYLDMLCKHRTTFAV